ncbi:MAG: hypothetical protein PHQ00_03950 [Phycisphaerae bacterium]|nr:hypothetical protein [Phycisphaerae bacterium]
MTAPIKKINIPASNGIFVELTGSRTQNILWKGLNESVIKRIDIGKNVKSSALITD